MPGYKGISIKDAIAAINNRDYLLPDIQRKFVWNTHQICVLFDSIIRGFPINTFMMWEIKKEEIKKKYKFYAFLDSYSQGLNEDNLIVQTTANFKDFIAIIDGQHRLTSLYIGLCGTYSCDQSLVCGSDSKVDSVLLPGKLYLDLKQPKKTEDNDALMYYNLKFLTEDEYKNSIVDAEHSHHWFCMHELLILSHRERIDEIWHEVLIPELEKRGLDNNKFARETLVEIYSIFNMLQIIRYYEVTNQEIDHVLNVLTRTNGGIKPAFADLFAPPRS